MREGFIELDGELLLDFALDEFKAAHDRHDHRAAQLVVVVELEAAVGRKVPRADRRI